MIGSLAHRRNSRLRLTLCVSLPAQNLVALDLRIVSGVNIGRFLQPFQNRVVTSQRSRRQLVVLHVSSGHALSPENSEGREAFRRCSRYGCQCCQRLPVVHLHQVHGLQPVVAAGAGVLHVIHPRHRLHLLSDGFKLAGQLACLLIFARLQPGIHQELVRVQLMRRTRLMLLFILL